VSQSLATGNRRAKLELVAKISLFRQNYDFSAVRQRRQTHSLAVDISLFVWPSVKRMHCDEKKQTSAHIFMLYQRLIILVFRQEECLVGDGPFYLKFWANLTPFLQKRRFLIDNRS